MSHAELSHIGPSIRQLGQQGDCGTSSSPTSAARVCDFIQMIPLEFHGSKIDEDPIDFIEEAYRVVAVIGITTEEKAKLVAYKASLWQNQIV